jgi:hypothetical protein
LLNGERLIPSLRRVNFLPETNIKELIATLVHTQWSLWQEQQDKQKIQNNAGTVEFADSTWQEWNRKSNTPFKLLTPEEQKSDREIAEKLWIPMIRSWIREKPTRAMIFQEDGLSIHLIIKRDLLKDLKV